MACAGARPGDIVHNAYGYGLFTGGLGAHYGGECLGCTVTPVSGGFTERQIVLIQDFGARVLCATPSYALNIAEVAEKEGYDIRSSKLEVGVFGAEPWSEAMRAQIEARMGLRAVDIYGLSEIIGPGVAAEEGESQQGLHGWEDCFLFEIIDPETCARKAPGETGELVITTLAKWAQPMIRYRTRDITWLNDEPSAATGRTHARIMRITGRDDDMDTMIVECEASPGVPVETYEQIGADIEHHIKSLIGVTCRAVVLSPGEVPRSEGKAVRVRDLRGK